MATLLAALVVGHLADRCLWLDPASRRVFFHALPTSDAGLLRDERRTHDLRPAHFWQDSLHPVCEFDLVRYSTAVSADAFCFEGQQVVTTAPPLPSIFTCLVVILAGAAVMWRHRFPWMFFGGVLMLASAAPAFRALKLDNFGEILIAGGCIWAITHFSRKAN